MKVFPDFFSILVMGPALLSSPLKAQLVTYERFEEYPAGSQLEIGASGSDGTGFEGGFGWNSPWDVNRAIKTLIRVENRTANPVNFDLGEISIRGGRQALRFYDIANGSYAVQRALAVPFTAADGNDLWFSFLFRTGNASPLSNQDFFQVGFDDNSGASGGNPRISIGANTITNSFPPNQPFRFFARSTTATTASAFADAIDIAAGTTYLLIGRVSASAENYDLVELYVNPDSLSTPGIPSASYSADSGLATLSHFFIRTSGLDNGDAYVIDELKIGRTYAAIILPEPPEPTLTITAGPPGTIGILRWPAILGTVLETTSDPASALWPPVPGPFAVEGEDHIWPILPSPGTSREFFRLSAE